MHRWTKNFNTLWLAISAVGIFLIFATELGIQWNRKLRCVFGQIWSGISRLAEVCQNFQEEAFRVPDIMYVMMLKISWKWRAEINIFPLSANPTKWSNTFKQFVSNLLTNCLGMFDHFVKLALKRLINLFKG